MKNILNFSVVLLTCVALSAQSKSAHSREQSVFGLGDDRPVVQHSVALSDAELDVLAKDGLMKREMDQDPPITKLTGEGIEAAVIHLGSARERDLIVVGSGRPFVGANVGPFWIIRDLPKGPRVVFGFTTLGLTIQSTHSHGLRNIEAFGATAVEGTTTILHFNGIRYVVYSQKTKPLGVGH
jgi:hypothetical protein